jgi:D-glycero-D-manno-heptose 1,7-bisphosphate phosphatase
VFLDRDGVISSPESYRTGPDALELIPGSADAIARLRAAGLAVVVVSNQSAIGLGYVTRHIVEAVNDRMCELLARTAGEVGVPDAILFSVAAGEHAVHPKWAGQSDAESKRSMMEQATRALELGKPAWVVGDRAQDLEAASAFGATPVLVRTGAGRTTQTEVDLRGFRNLIVLEDLAKVATHIVGTRQST